MMVLIQNIKAGMKLAENVHSKLGGTIFKKGTILQNGDKEILEAFGIEEIAIESDKIEDKLNIELIKDKKSKIKNNEIKLSFADLFNQSLRKVDNMLNLVQSNVHLDIYELRRTIQPLLNESFVDLKYLKTLRYMNTSKVKYESHHSLSVAIISFAIAKWLNIYNTDLMQIALAGVLHDVGMSRVTYNFRNKKIEKNSWERDEINKHTIYSYQILKETKGLSEGALLAILQHHEREDGSGYPLQLKGQQIHVYAKIIAVADIFHAMISEREFRPEFSPFIAIDELLTDGFGKLDPVIVRVFVNNICKHLVGTNVLLNNDDEGTIIFASQQNPTKPWVKVNNKVIELDKEKNIYIKAII